MLTIFGNSVATVQYAKGSNEPLATEMEDNGGPEGDDKEVDGKCGTTTVDDNEASSSATKPSKRAKISESDDEGLIGAFKSAGERIAIAIERAGTADNTLPPDLFNKVISILGFEKTYKSLYYAHLVEYPHIGRAFYALPFDHKLTWLGKFIGDKFPRC
uniref:Uncharacterized protein n=1 Tax=Arundo donax TaxID=35708 RepID=A0A0A9BEC0_ARUDO